MPEIDPANMAVADCVQHMVNILAQHKNDLAGLKYNYDEIVDRLQQAEDKMNALDANGILKPVLASSGSSSSSSAAGGGGAGVSID